MIYIIGLGIEGKVSLSQRALALIENAFVLIGGKRHLAAFPEFNGKKIVIGSDLDDVAESIAGRKPQAASHAAVLATGDPNFFGIADFMIKKFGKKAVEIIPNVSSMQYAFARIKESWNDARFLSLHGRNRSQKEKAIESIADEMRGYEKIGIFTDPDNTPAKIAKALLYNGVKDYRAYVCADLGTEKETITEGTLAQIARRKYSPLNVMVLIRSRESEVRSQEEKAFYAPRITHHGILGVPDSSFSHSKGMITKEEIRVVSLSKLKLKTDSIVWDIGAGSGSLSIEAAMLANKGRVFAVEKQAERIRHIEKNKKKFKTTNLEIIHKKAPDGLKTLPVPDAVFIGGAGKDIDKILKVCSKRITNGGRIVVNAITLETLAAATGFFEDKGWHDETLSVNIAKTRDIAGLHIFSAHNPVFIVVGEKP